MMLATSAACASPEMFEEGLVFDPCLTTNLLYDESASPAEVAQIHEAAAMWNREVGSQLHVSPVENGSDNTIPVHFEPAAGVFYGIYEPSTGEIFVNSKLPSEESSRITLAHELGHAFGLQHVSGAPSLMNSGNLQTQITARDVASLTSLWGACNQAPATEETWR